MYLNNGKYTYMAIGMLRGVQIKFYCKRIYSQEALVYDVFPMNAKFLNVHTRYIYRQPLTVHYCTS